MYGKTQAVRSFPSTSASFHELSKPPKAWCLQTQDHPHQSTTRDTTASNRQFRFHKQW